MEPLTKPSSIVRLHHYKRRHNNLTNIYKLGGNVKGRRVSRLSYYVAQLSRLTKHILNYTKCSREQAR